MSGQGKDGGGARRARSDLARDRNYRLGRPAAPRARPPPAPSPRALEKDGTAIFSKPLLVREEIEKNGFFLIFFLLLCLALSEGVCIASFCSEFLLFLSVPPTLLLNFFPVQAELSVGFGQRPLIAEFLFHFYLNLGNF